MNAEQDNSPEDIRVLDPIPDAKKRSHWTHETGRDKLDFMIELDAMKRWYCSVPWPLLDMAFHYQSHAEPKQMSVPFPHLMVSADLYIARSLYQRVSTLNWRLVL
ncbi:hypothetical protein K469DRAFT_761408 [Zopfia rhizophila CBS 207.26]|uniref:Uncharacterized protein n=1 Tax=Zopfia rhizophila CBS 207.26 TaxID=1314779 RepID=A0A6A6DDK5_9PEZI|nr:hypothetical protein K469DRAFT_761408 [Zopfia rhizophila CBS 207.26]